MPLIIPLFGITNSNHTFGWLRGSTKYAFDWPKMKLLTSGFFCCLGKRLQIVKRPEHRNSENDIRLKSPKNCEFFALNGPHFFFTNIWKHTHHFLQSPMCVRHSRNGFSSLLHMFNRQSEVRGWVGVYVVCDVLLYDGRSRTGLCVRFFYGWYEVELLWYTFPCSGNGRSEIHLFFIRNF